MDPEAALRPVAVRKRERVTVSSLSMARAGRLVLLLLLVRWTWLFLAWPMRQDVIGASFLHVISIPFHEAGHILFSPFGDLLTSLGGSLAQVLVPIVCGIAFLTTSPNPFAAAVMCWWTGENLLDVALYIDDARALQLVLIGRPHGRRSRRARLGAHPSADGPAAPRSSDRPRRSVPWRRAHDRRARMGDRCAGRPSKALPRRPKSAVKRYHGGHGAEAR